MSPSDAQGILHAIDHPGAGALEELDHEAILEAVCAELTGLGLTWLLAGFDPDSRGWKVEGTNASQDDLQARLAERASQATLAGMTGWLQRMEARQPVYMMDADSEARSGDSLMAFLNDLGAGRRVLAPILERGRVTGALAVWGDGLVEEHVSVITALAGLLSTTLENARLIRESLAQARRAGVLAEIAALAARVEDDMSLLEDAGRLILDELGLEFATFSAVDWETRTVVTLHEVSASSLPERIRNLPHFARLMQFEQPGTFYSIDEYPSTLQTLEPGGPVWVRLADENADPAEAALLHKMGLGTLLMLPMTTTGKPGGLVEFYWVDPDVSLGQPEMTFLGTAVEQIALALEKVRLAAETRSRQQALLVSEQRYALAVQGANDGLWDWDLRTGEVFYSPRWKAILGYGAEELDPNPDAWLSRVHPADRRALRKELDLHLQGKTEHFENEHRLLRKDSSYRWVLSRGLAVRAEDGAAYRVAGSLTDISDRKAVEAQLVHDALHDSLTGLPNRALFMDRLEQAIARTERAHIGGFAVLFVDIDRFKVINDSLGHLAGDALLRMIAGRLSDSVRKIDTVARLGGDEFAVVVDALTSEADATHVAERIREAVGAPFLVEGSEIFVTASIGIATSSVGYERPEEVLRDADIAMYRAKGLGKNRFHIFDSAMRTHALEQLELETDLRRALGRGEFLLHFQPMVSLATGTVAGVEALLRWRRPGFGLLLPAEIIPLAEETGLILPIGEWVLVEACRQFRVWQEEFPDAAGWTVSVNLSSKQLTHPDLLDQVDRALKTAELEPGSLRIEITENALMEDLDCAVEVVGRLKSLGVHIDIDDFGKGFSSLGYLHHFPADALKVDRAFIAGLGFDGENTEVVRTIVALARSLDKQVIAEGIETTSQLETLRDLGCQLGQGYLFSTALPAEEVPEALRALTARPVLPA